MLFIAETFNPNMQHYSSKTKSPLNMSGRYTSIYPLNFNSDIKQYHLLLFKNSPWVVTYICVSVLCLLPESLKSVFQKRERCIVCGIEPVTQF